MDSICVPSMNILKKKNPSSRDSANDSVKQDILQVSKYEHN